MNSEKVQRLAQLATQLSETLMTAAICAQEIRSEIIAEQDAWDAKAVGGDADGRRRGSSMTSRPLLDQTTLRVCWNGKSLHLGHTRAFSLLDRLSRCPNQYVTHLDLLNDVWDNEELSTATIRSAIRHLRRRLRDGKMAELAAAIRGHNGRYVLNL